MVRALAAGTAVQLALALPLFVARADDDDEGGAAAASGGDGNQHDFDLVPDGDLDHRGDVGDVRRYRHIHHHGDRDQFDGRAPLS